MKILINILAVFGFMTVVYLLWILTGMFFMYVYGMVEKMLDWFGCDGDDRSRK